MALFESGNAEGVTLGDDGYCYRGQSYFTRLSYDYAGNIC